MSSAFCRKHGNLLNTPRSPRYKISSRVRVLLVYKQEDPIAPPPSSRLSFNIATNPELLFSTLLRCATVASELHLTAASALLITCFQSQECLHSMWPCFQSCASFIQTYKLLLTPNNSARRICMAMYFYARCISLICCRLSF